MQLLYIMLFELAKFRPKLHLIPDLSNASALFFQLSYPANLELVIIWVYEKPVDSEYMIVF